MLDGTLVFEDSLQRPRHLDVASCDFLYPLEPSLQSIKQTSTRDVRKCYRSKRVSIGAVLAGLDDPAINACVYVHNAEKLVPGSVRLGFWRKIQSQYNANAIVPELVLDEEYVEMVVATTTSIKGMAIGTTRLDSVFDSLQVTVMIPCTGVSVYLLKPNILNRGPKVTSGVPVDAPLIDTFDYSQLQS